MVQEVPGHEQCEGPHSGLGAVLPRLQEDIQATTSGVCVCVCVYVSIYVYMNLLCYGKSMLYKEYNISLGS